MKIISIPEELKVLKQKYPKLEKIGTIEQIRDFENNILRTNYLTYQKMEIERGNFRMYLNIKRRYRLDPQKFIRLFKLYLNEVPSFQDR